MVVFTEYGFKGLIAVSQLQYPNGLTASWTYDANNQLLQVRNATPTNVISQFDYTYDAAGRRTAIAKSGSAFGDLSGSIDAYTYNARSELTSARRTKNDQPIPGFSEDFDYDPIGNRRSSATYNEKGEAQTSTYQANNLNQYTNFVTAIAGAERVFEVMDSPKESDEVKPDIDVNKVKGDIDFDEIEFAYKQGEPVLKKFDLHVKQGQTIAIVGRTGSGKTTVVNLLTRFYDLDGGRIMLDGKDITEISKKSLRDSIGIVLQDTVLFTDTIANNIRYGNQNATDEQVRAAAHTANADVFIERLPDGYNTLLTGSGANLSQGQRQLLAIARAVLADPKILILDEATSSVDTRTEMQIQQAMIKLMENRTSLVIAHRLSTIRGADKIIVLSDGHIVESGNHDELLEKKGVYYDLYMTQFSGVET